MGMHGNVNVKFEIMSRIPSEGIYVSVVCSTHFETRRPEVPLVVLGIEEKRA